MSQLAADIVWLAEGGKMCFATVQYLQCLVWKDPVLHITDNMPVNILCCVQTV